MNAKKKTDSAPKLLSFDEYLTSLEEMEAAEKKPAQKKAKKAPAKKPSAKKAEKAAAKKAATKAPAVAPAEDTMTIALPRGVELAMVRIPGKDYWMGKFQVTQAQWEAVMGRNPSESEGADNPVENVSWDSCQRFLNKLNARPAAKASGLVFRLPEADEWEYACRAGATGDYCKLADGTEITEKTLGEVAWFRDNADEDHCGCLSSSTHPVGRKKPNAFGLYDMHGNVDEWTATADGRSFVSCGGCSLSWAEHCESSQRSSNKPDFKLPLLGFRLCASKAESAVFEGILALPRRVELAMVRIPGKDYWMGKFPVTQEQWVAVMGKNPSVDYGSKKPVEQVSWNDCQAFLKKLNAQPAAKASGLVFRLPEEGEWETACRAGATGDYCKLADGTEITGETLGEVAWFKDNANRETHPVGEKKPNAFGLYDMHGNVGEWTATADGAYRVLRGGSWAFAAKFCESSNRRWKKPDCRLGYFGFRLCASGADEKEEAAPAKKKARADVPAIVEGIIASMVPIPGKDYRMGKFPVTQAQWEAVMGENPSEFRIPENPVETVSWDDCQAFLKTLNAQPAAKASGLVFRLPEADEWEYACRAGATGKYCKLADGTEITEETLGEVAWFGEDSDEMTHPVGEKKPNAFGLYDMHGNVCEWTATADGEDRVASGGGWTYKAEYCESSFRDWFDLSTRYYYIGFRLCASGRAD